MSGTTTAAAQPFDVARALGDGHDAQSIADYLAANPQRAPLGATGQPFNVAKALQDGHSAASIVDHLNGSAAGSTVQGVPALGAIGRGAAQAEAGVANLLDDVGLKGAGHAVRATINTEDLTAPTTAGDLVSSLKQGSYGRALSDLPGAVLESAPAIAAGAAGVAAAPLVGAAATPAALGAGALYGAATTGDSIARARAANNGDQAPSTADLAVGLGAGAGAGVLGAVGDGFGGVLQTAGLRGVIGRLLGSATTQGQRIAADAAAPQLQALAASAGTNAGAQGASGADSAAAALTGLATRAGFSVPDALSSVPVTSAGRAAALADKWNSLDATGQQDALDVAASGQALKSAMDQSPQLSPTQAAKGIITDQAGQVAALASKLKQVGAIDSDGQAAIGAAVSAARDGTRALTPDHLQAVSDLGLDGDTDGAIQDTLRRIQLLSAVDDSGSGPFQAIGAAAGSPLAGAALGSIAGGHGAELGAVLGSLVRPIASQRLGQLGAALDDRLGTTPAPSLVKSGDAAASMLGAAGVQVPDTSGALQDSFNASRDAVAQQKALIAAQTEAEGIDAGFNRDQAAAWNSTLKEAYSANSASDAIEAARKAMDADLAHRADLQERAADLVSGMAYRTPAARDAREAGLVGFPATQVDGSPSSVFAASGGRLGSPVDGPTSMNGIVAPSQPSAAPTNGGPAGIPAPPTSGSSQGSTAGFQEAPAPSSPSPIDPVLASYLARTKVANDTGQPNAPTTPPPAAPQGTPSLATPPPGPVSSPPGATAPSGPGAAVIARYQGTGPAAGGAASPAVAAQGVPVASNDPVAAALARSQLAQLTAPARRPQTDLSALPPGAQAQAQKLSEAVFRHGMDLQNALVASGQARPVNMQAEYNASLDGLVSKGFMEPGLAAALKSYRGRVVPAIYDLVRQESLLRHSINRTVGGD